VQPEDAQPEVAQPPAEPPPPAPAPAFAPPPEPPSPWDRVVQFRPRTVLTILAIVLSVFALIEVIQLARQVITWIFIALFLALALNPLVDLLQRKGVRRRGLAIASTFLLLFLACTAIGFMFVPTLIDEANGFADAVPDYVDDLTHGEGRLGFLQEDYQIVDRVRDAIGGGGASRVLGLSGTAFGLVTGVVTFVVATVTILALTFFMLLEGPRWIERGLSLLPPESHERWERIGHQVYHTVGGYVTGALTISIIAGLVTSVLLSVLSIQYALALGLLVAILDLIPLAGATLATILVTTVTFIDGGVTKGLIVLVFFIVYQQVENHVLYPLVYSRTVQLSPLAILVAVLIGASLAGILGALAAIPVAGTIQVLLLDWLHYRRGAVETPPGVELETG
jgi:predicted PurR-regulated permease PerM